MGKLDQSLESMREQIGNLVYQRLIAERKKAEAEKNIGFLDIEIAKLECAMNATSSIGGAALAEEQARCAEQIELIEKQNQRPIKAARKDKR